jgi:hypothetical protein
MQQTRRRLDPHDGGQVVAEGTRIDDSAISGDHPSLLEPLNAFGYRRRGQVHAPAELGEGSPPVGHEFADDFYVNSVNSCLTDWL